MVTFWVKPQKHHDNEQWNSFTSQEWNYLKNKCNENTEQYIMSQASIKRKVYFRSTDLSTSNTRIMCLCKI
jgi:hypothetical protein